MRTISVWLVAASRRWWILGIVAALNFVSFRVLFALEDKFEAVAGVPTFDTQNVLTVATLLAQLPRYVGAARAAYGWFAALIGSFRLFRPCFWRCCGRGCCAPTRYRLPNGCCGGTRPCGCLPSRCSIGWKT